MNHIEVHEEPAIKQTDNPKTAQRDQTEASEEPRLNQRCDAADSLRKRFLEASGQFYYRTAPGEPTKVAFTDHGKRLITEHDDPSVIHGMVLRAQEKGWTVVRVSGTDEFKTEAWVQATIAGLELEGYTRVESTWRSGKIDETSALCAVQPRKSRVIQRLRSKKRRVLLSDRTRP